MEKIIKKAIEGGWIAKSTVNGIPMTKKNWQAQFILAGHFADVWLLDPLFWEALGRACSWEPVVMTTKQKLEGNNNFPNSDFINMTSAVFYALRFHELNLTEGWSKAVTWLSALVGTEIV